MLYGYPRAASTNYERKKINVSKEYIRDKNFRTIGSVDTDSSGKQRGYDAHFHQVGNYDPQSDRTYDSSYRLVGNGNQLVGLVWQAAGK